MSLAFQGTTVLVTGGTSGLGLAIARRFLAEGANVAVCGTSEASVAAAGLSQPSAFACVADVSSPAEVEGFVAAATERFGRVDVAVCNAAIQGPIGPVEATPWEDWRRTVEVNLYGVVLTCRAVAPLMRRQGRGKIVAISGGGATQGRPGFSAYAAAKTAVVRFIETLALELAGTGVDVNAIAPGSLNTRMLDQILAAGPERGGAEGYAAAVRQREDGGTPLDLPVDLVAFLASHASDGISGRLIAARWDDWRHLPQARLSTDDYTLRRMLPQEPA